MGVENDGGDGDETKRVADVPFSTCACFNLGERETSSEEEEAGFGGTPGNYHRRVDKGQGTAKTNSSVAQRTVSPFSSIFLTNRKAFLRKFIGTHVSMTPNTHYPTRGMGDLSFIFYTSTADADASAKGRSRSLLCPVSAAACSCASVLADCRVGLQMTLGNNLSQR